MRYTNILFTYLLAWCLVDVTAADEPFGAALCSVFGVVYRSPQRSGCSSERREVGTGFHSSEYNSRQFTAVSYTTDDRRKAAIVVVVFKHVLLSKDLVSGTVYLLSCRHFTYCIQTQTENLSVRHHITNSAHLQHHFTVAFATCELVLY